MVEIANRAQLKDWLERQDGEFAVAIAIRGALRVLPAIAEFVGQQPSERSATCVLPLFRARA